MEMKRPQFQMMVLGSLMFLFLFLYPSSHLLAPRLLLLGISISMSQGIAFRRGKWNKLVESAMEKEYENTYNEILWQLQGTPRLLTYLQETWLVYKERFVYAWTNKVLHFGNTTTNRVKSVHSSLKTWLGSSTGGFDTVWQQIQSQLQCQFNAIRTEFAKSMRIQKHVVLYPCFHHLFGLVTHYALSKIDDEHKLGQSVGIWSDPHICNNYLRNTYALPCVHEITQKEHDGDAFYSHDIHVFWRIINLDAPLDPNLDEEVCMQLQQQIDEAKTRT